MSDTLEIFGIEYQGVDGFKAEDDNGNVLTFYRPQGTKSIGSNGTVDVAAYASASVNVPNSYSASDEGKVVSSGALVAQTSDTVTANDTYDTTLINSLTVNVSGGSDAVLNRIVERTYSGSLSLTVTKLGPNALRKCADVTLVCVPNCTQVDAEALKEMTALVTADLGNSASIEDMAFQSDSNLTTIILRRSSVCALVNGRAFLYTRFASGGSGGTIYVPSSLISSYQGASNWSTINGYGTITWAAIEGSYYETHYADGTVIS